VVVNSYIASLSGKDELGVMMICLGNICRSPMAAAVLAHQANQVEIPTIKVSSSGTGSWHVGEGPNPKSRTTWEAAGYSYDHTVQQFKRNMFDQQDLLLVMDRSNYRDVIELTDDTNHQQKVFYLRQFDPQLSHLDPTQHYSKLEVPDPYYEPISAFQEVLKMVETAVSGLVNQLTVGR
jgi:protein-tyrosine phosphatase